MTETPRTQPAARKKPQNGEGTLKALIAVGGLAATLIGADLIARRDATPPVTASAPTALVIENPQTGQPFVFDAQPIPELVIPQPVARSRSSR